MGTNFPDFLREANRVLKTGGKVFIAEVVSRFADIDAFSQKYILNYSGFKLLKLNKLEDFFYIMVCKKVAESKVMPNNKMEEYSAQLKPCLYKKR